MRCLVQHPHFLLAMPSRVLSSVLTADMAALPDGLYCHLDLHSKHSPYSCVVSDGNPFWKATVLESHPLLVGSSQLNTLVCLLRVFLL